MKPGGRGRIVFWPGGSLWIGRAEGSTELHSHHAVQMTFALPGSHVRFREPQGEWQSHEAAVVPTHQVHAMEAPGKEVALVFAEPESRNGRAIHLRYRGGVSPLASAPADPLFAAYRHGESDAALVACARRVIAALAGGSAAAEAPLDSRIARAIELLRPRLDETVKLGEIAGAVHLSPDRFRHLFLEQTGVRFRPYVLWQRVERAVAEYASGSTLTQAAQAGGFADSAHFSRTFRRMFGLPPAAIRIE